jgi:glutamine synthetase
VVGKIPEILLDNTDRNRTSPFAFTGNKFEFRAVGSSANCATPMTVLNMIMAKQLKEFKATVDKMIDEGMKKDDAIFNVLREYIKVSKKIRFEGDGYSSAWEKEAGKRKLSNNKTTPKALKSKVKPEAVSLFEEMGIMNPVELHARYEIQVEEYVKRIQIESRVLGDIALNHIVPVGIRYQNRLTTNVKDMKDIFGKEFKVVAKEQMGLIEKISEHIKIISEKVAQMVETRKVVNKIEDVEELADAYCEQVKPFFEEIRYHCDKLEMMVDDDLWPMSKYREMLFTK